ncbi:MAG: DUF2889 domain-containing protein [Deltaproteobacteria bacterium]|nr:DUF2889 domain-containing protein [Deltaproteobacteria bacterium]
MPFREPAPRKLLHSRRIACDGYAREDGLWDVEAYLTDARTYPMPLLSGGVRAPNEPFHCLGLRVTVDGDWVIRRVEVATDRVPARECELVGVLYERLVGLKIRPGFNAKIKKLFQGAAGCTHLTELLGTVATAAYQTLSRMRRISQAYESGALEGPLAKNLVAYQKVDGIDARSILNTCFAMRSDGEVGRELLSAGSGLGQAASAEAGTETDDEVPNP